MPWGDYGSEPACEHLLALRAFLEKHKLSIHAEHADTGWCNVHCATCKRTYEVVLREPWPED